MRTLFVVLSAVLLMAGRAAAGNVYDGCENVWPNPAPLAPVIGDQMTAQVTAGSTGFANQKSMTFWPLSLPGFTQTISPVSDCPVGSSCPPSGAPVYTMAWPAFANNDRIDNQFFYLGQPSDNVNNFCVSHVSWVPPTLTPCSPFGYCTAHTIMFCTGLTGTLIGDPGSQCVGPLGIVNPLDCTCKTRLLHIPWTPEQKNQFARNQAFYRNLTGSLSVIFPALPWSYNPMKWLYGVSQMMENFFARLAADPPDANFTVLDVPVPVPYTLMTTKDGVTAAQASAMNALQAIVSRQAGDLRTMAVSGDRFGGAVVGNGPGWQTPQLDNYNAYVPEYQALVAQMAQAFAGLASPTWGPQGGKYRTDYRPLFAPLYDPTALARWTETATTDILADAP